jgi:hypothetical protein
MNSRALAALLAAGTACTLAGCGGSSSAASPPDHTPGASGSPAASSASAQPQPRAAKGSNVCADLPAAAASQITGTKFTTAKASSVEGVVFECEYSGPGSALLQVSVDTEGAKQVYDTDISALKAVSHPPNSVSGVGDEAFSEPDPQGNAGSIGASAFASYGAVFGDTYIKIGGLTYVTASQGKQIAEQLHAKF